MDSTKTHAIRPPIIAVLGHVDHGKSTLLDYIRKSNTVAGEAGGITQHVAAYEVAHPRQDGALSRITFIDTPGHAAFKSIRARGASIADIAILVVSAEDGVKAQTLEALESITASKIPMVVAITKIDKPAADVEMAKRSLLEHGVYLEGLGGDIPYAPVSAKSGQGIPELLDLLLLVAEMEELTGDPDAPASGFVIEAHRDPKRGIAATLIITDGSLATGEAALAGGAVAPLRIVEDHAGTALKHASFSTPITVFGFDGLPQVGAPFTTYPTKKAAEAARSEAAARKPAYTQPSQVAEGTFALPILVKADVAGSLEAIVGEIAKLGDEHALVSVIGSGIGAVTESDVKLAVAGSGTTPVIIAFDVPTDANAIEAARQHGIEIETFDIIYKLTERLAELLRERAPKRVIEVTSGKARVLKRFSAAKTLQTVGGKVFEGFIEKGGVVRISRKDSPIGTGRIETLQVNRAAVTRVEAGNEFGAQIETTIELAPSDLLESVSTRTE
ncbi:MAG TPA: translation initiation factor IF-2 [Candidatus Paceibacterota bacterium]|nr:translation initiation factor IF-2 [Candidatus Paceibacterota bacterium]